MIARLIIIALLALTISLAAYTGSKESRRPMTLAEAVDRVRPSIVQIRYSVIGISGRIGHAHGSLGTGFLVNTDGYVITAGHVITKGRALLDQIQADRKDLLVGLAMPNMDEPIKMRGNFVIYEFDVIDKDEIHDIALLKLKSNPFEKVPTPIKIGDREIKLPLGVALLDAKKPRDGAAVAISGYPLSEPVLVTNAGSMATTWSYKISEIHPPGAPDWFRMPDVADSYLADLQANPGNSGGPVYLIENGLVVGVCLGSKAVPVQEVSAQGEHQAATTADGRPLVYASGLTVVVPAQYVIDLLKKNGLKWTEPE